MTTTDCRHCACRYFENSRARMSIDPPGAFGTTSVTVWLGKSCARAALGAPRRAARIERSVETSATTLRSLILIIVSSLEQVLVMCDQRGSLLGLLPPPRNSGLPEFR